MRVADLLIADPLTGGRTIAPSDLLPLRLTNSIRNTGLRQAALTEVGKSYLYLRSTPDLANYDASSDNEPANPSTGIP